MPRIISKSFISKTIRSAGNTKCPRGIGHLLHMKVETWFTPVGILIFHSLLSLTIFRLCNFANAAAIKECEAFESNNTTALTLNKGTMPTKQKSLLMSLFYVQQVSNTNFFSTMSYHYYLEQRLRNC